MEKTTVIKSLKKGHFVLIDNVPCRVVSIAITKSGKHGGSKCRVEGMGLFDGRRRSIVKPSDAKVSVPVVLKKSAQVLAIVGNNAQLMDLSDYSTFELS
ncbi:translation initiation factor IF-5A, partial [Candidatus Woesearchaeota archaeon]